MRVIMPAIIDQAGRSFNADETDGVSGRDNMHRTSPRPSPTWRSFLTAHAREIVAIDFFVVPTLTFHLLFVFVVPAITPNPPRQRDGSPLSSLDGPAGDHSSQSALAEPLCGTSDRLHPPRVPDHFLVPMRPICAACVPTSPTTTPCVPIKRSRTTGRVTVQLQSRTSATPPPVPARRRSASGGGSACARSPWDRPCGQPVAQSSSFGVGLAAPGSAHHIVIVRPDPRRLHQGRLNLTRLPTRFLTGTGVTGGGDSQLCGDVLERNLQRPTRVLGRGSRPSHGAPSATSV